jgi:hypothetical protein
VERVGEVADFQQHDATAGVGSSRPPRPGLGRTRRGRFALESRVKGRDGSGALPPGKARRFRTGEGAFDDGHSRDHIAR